MEKSPETDITSAQDGGDDSSLLPSHPVPNSVHTTSMVNDSLSMSQDSLQQPKKKRGRPRKIVPGQNSAESQPATGKLPVAGGNKDDTLGQMSVPPSDVPTDNGCVSPRHSTPQAAWKADSSSVCDPGASPILGRRSGREKKRTAKEANLDQLLKDHGQKTSAGSAPEAPKDFCSEQKKTPGRPGRPRKNASQVLASREKSLMHCSDEEDKETGDTQQAEKMEPVAMKKKRGRPRKAESFASLSVSNQSNLKAESSMSFNVSISNQQAEKTEPVAVKKKRGRPRKAESSTSLNVSNQSNLKAESSMSLYVSHGSNSSQRRGAGGRSPAERVQRTRDASEDSQLSGVEKITLLTAVNADRSSGSLPSHETSEYYGLQTPSRRRGQSRKKEVTLNSNDTADDSDLETDSSAMMQPTEQRNAGPTPDRGQDSVSVKGEEKAGSKKKQKQESGRKPAKKNSSTAQKRVEEADDTLIEKCLRCEEPMESLADYKRHLRSRHAALYTKACPEGDQSPDAMLTIFKAAKSISCPKCQRPFKNLQYFKHHIVWCGREDEKEQCELCDHWVKAMWMYQHVREHRKRDRREEEKRQRRERKVEGEEEEEEGGRGHKRKAAQEALRTLKEVTDGNDPDGEGRQPRGKKRKVDETWEAEGKDEEDDDIPDEGRGRERRDRPRMVRVSLPTGEYSDGRKLSFPRVYTIDTFVEHERHLEELGETTLHGHLLPVVSQWTRLSDSEAKQYLPLSKKSVKFSVSQYNKERLAQTSTLRLGETVCDDSQATGFAGGPVKAVEWCPLGRCATRGQVVAAAVGRALWASQECFKQQGGPGCLQFWSTGTLDGRQSSCKPELRVAFTLAHSQGHVVSIAWCPRGGYIDQPPTEAGFLQRLGLLVVAGWDSSLLLYSIPTPESLSCDQTECAGSTTPPTYRPAPTLTLACVKPEAFGPCLSVAWQKGGNCDFIAAGYAQGFAHLWHLSSGQQQVAAGETLSPVRTLLAHPTAVQTVDWSWTDPGYFLTGGLDSYVKVWDVENTAMPVSSLPWQQKDIRGPVTAACFSSAAVDGLVFAEDQRHKYTGGVYGVDLTTGPTLSTASVLPWTGIDKQAATIWDFGYSPWFNVTVSGGNTGRLTLATCWPIHNMRAKQLTQKRKGQVVFSTSLSSSAQDKNGSTSGLEDSAPSDLKILFVDRSMKAARDLIKAEDEMAPCRQTFGNFQGADIFSVRMSPNQSSSEWVAVGTKAGFLRLLHLPCLAAMHPSSQRFFSHRHHATHGKGDNSVTGIKTSSSHSKGVNSVTGINPSSKSKGENCVADMAGT